MALVGRRRCSVREAALVSVEERKGGQVFGSACGGLGSDDVGDGGDRDGLADQVDDDGGDLEVVVAAASGLERDVELTGIAHEVSHVGPGERLGVVGEGKPAIDGVGADQRSQLAQRI